jgi:decaprenylphospho-beta-D-erythro-pentofuranosid-2-ulose 2-reductase
MKKILIIGATSAIAEAVAREYATQGATLFLMARDAERLHTLVHDLHIRGAQQVHALPFEATAYDTHPTCLQKAVDHLQGLDLAFIAHGTLGEQENDQHSFAATLKQLEVNQLSVISLLTWLANYCEPLRHGTLAVVGSVAGDRGRQSNYIYGTAKGAVAVFLQGLRNRLAPSGVHVITLKPGFVDTPMTSSFNKGKLWSQPHDVARLMVKAIAQRKNVAYVPGWWALVMAVIQHIPEALFKKLKL